MNDTAECVLVSERGCHGMTASVGEHRSPHAMQNEVFSAENARDER